MWICRLNFAQRNIFSILEVLWRAWNIRLVTNGLKSLPEDLYSGFLRPEKIHRPQPDLNPRTADLQASYCITYYYSKIVTFTYFLFSTVVWCSSFPFSSIYPLSFPQSSFLHSAGSTNFLCTMSSSQHSASRRKPINDNLGHLSSIILCMCPYHFKI